MKRIKNIFVILISILLLNGCVKNSNTMTINKDKSMLFETEVLVSDSIDNNNIDSSILKEYESHGLKITTVKEEKYSGYKISRKFSNIDNISSDSLNKINVNDILTQEEKDLKVFKMSHSFLKDTYSVSIEYEFNVKDKDKYYKEPITVSDNDEEDLTELNKTAELSSEMDFRFVVNLPSKSISNNASSENENTLIWNIKPENGKTNIDFSFSIYNLKSIIILGVAGISLIVCLVVVLVLIKKKHNSKDTLILKDYDPSIEDKIIGLESNNEVDYKEDNTIENNVNNNPLNNTQIVTNDVQNNVVNNQNIPINNQNVIVNSNINVSNSEQNMVSENVNVPSESNVINQAVNEIQTTSQVVNNEI